MYTFNFRPISSGGFGFGPCTKAYWVLLCFCQHFVHIHDGAYIDEPRNYSRGAIVQQHLRIFKTLKWPVNLCSAIWFGIIHHAACNREKWSWKFEGLFWDHHGSLYTIRWCKMRCTYWLFCHSGIFSVRNQKHRWVSRKNINKVLELFHLSMQELFVPNTAYMYIYICFILFYALYFFIATYCYAFIVTHIIYWICLWC